ncbi:MAG: hypothetical protein NTV49_06330 [Kiritimatiellaeota bacterium]|nr:hypothetical protein [Kiritimatiellota bacterium]
MEVTLPKPGPSRTNGAVQDLRARGNSTVDIEWKDGKASAFKLRSPEPRPVKVRVNGRTQNATMEKQ